MKDKNKQDDSTPVLHTPEERIRKKAKKGLSIFFVMFRMAKVLVMSLLVSMSVVACENLPQIVIPPVEEPCTCELCDDEDCEDCTCGEHECTGPDCTKCADCDCGCNGSTE